MKNRHQLDETLSQAVAGAAPVWMEMFENVQQCSSPEPDSKTNPPARAATTPALHEADAPPAVPGRPQGGVAAPQPAGSSSEMFNNVQRSSAQPPAIKTKPIASADQLPPRQLAAARLLALGRTGRAVAGELGVEEHTISRWRRAPAFRDELRRQHDRILTEQVGQRRAEKVDGYRAAVEEIARKYGMAK